MNKGFFLALLLLAGMPFFGQGLQAQFYGSVGGGVAWPQGDLGKDHDTGFTLRGQGGISLAIVEAHVQAGMSRFSVVENPKDPEADDANIYHAGVGARVGLGFIFIGASAAYFSGEGESGMGYFPEIGLRFWRLEAVADYRVDGNENWSALRLNWRF